eukprot:5980262-Amphidinium_carterae.1
MRSISTVEQTTKQLDASIKTTALLNRLRGSVRDHLLFTIDMENPDYDKAIKKVHQHDYQSPSKTTIRIKSSHTTTTATIILQSSDSKPTRPVQQRQSLQHVLNVHTEVCTVMITMSTHGARCINEAANQTKSALCNVDNAWPEIRPLLSVLHLRVQETTGTDSTTSSTEA